MAQQHGHSVERIFFSTQLQQMEMVNWNWNCNECMYNVFGMNSFSSRNQHYQYTKRDTCCLRLLLFGVGVGIAWTESHVNGYGDVEFICTDICNCSWIWTKNKQKKNHLRWISSHPNMWWKENIIQKFYVFLSCFRLAMHHNMNI